MHEFLLNDGDVVNWYAWFAVLVLMCSWEAMAPRRHLGAPIRLRWFGNFSVMFIGMLLFWWLAPVLCVEYGRIVLARGSGVLPNVGCPLWLNILFAFFVLDLARYLIHRASHSNAMLWRIHRVHHTDQNFDFTTSMRFHPVELALVTTINLGIITALGLHPIAILLTESLSLVINTFNHGNVRLAPLFDRLLRTVIVTPDMHRVHHSSEVAEFDANLGGLWSWWDRAFGTYVAQPALGHESMTIGLRTYSEPKHATFWWMLLNPFITTPDRVVGEDTLRLG